MLNKHPIGRTELDEINEHIANEEAVTMDEGDAEYNAVQKAGNYPIEVITAALNIYANKQLTRITSFDNQPGIFVLGNGLHWTVVNRVNEKCTLYDDGKSYPLNIVRGFLGIILMLGWYYKFT